MPTDSALTLLAEMAKLMAKHKLVPFVGAGISRQQLGFAAAELAHEIAAELGETEDTLLSQLADRFVDGRGQAAFVNYLRGKLVRDEVDDERTQIHRQLICLTSSVVYTTNQDNLFELVAAKYGRPVRKVATLEDFGEAMPGERLLIKFHGDLDAPESLVFGARSYADRTAATDHPCDIRLKSDLLGKKLLFLGYSLRDENVIKVFTEVQRAFGGKLPPSYLIAFDDDPELLAAAERFQIKVVVPARLFPEARSPSQAFETCIKTLCEDSGRHQTDLGLRSLFSDVPFAPRMVTEEEVDAIDRLVETGSIVAALEEFRAHCDQAQIPTFLVERVTQILVSLADRADANSDDEMSALKYALFNFRPPITSALNAIGAYMAAFNRRRPQDGYDSLSSISAPAIPDNAIPLAASLAVAMLVQRNEIITDDFRRRAKFWFMNYDAVPDAAQASTVQMIECAWSGQHAADSPIARPLHSFGMKKGFHGIMRDLTASFPMQRDTPVE